MSTLLITAQIVCYGVGIISASLNIARLARLRRVRRQRTVRTTGLAAAPCEHHR